MKSWLCCIGFAAVAVFAGAACGDSSSDTGGGGAGGAGGTGGAGGSGGGDVCANPDAGTLTTIVCATVNDCDKFAYTATVPPVYTCNGNKSTKYPDGLNACRNQSDCDIINTGEVREIVKTVALSCRDREPKEGASEPERIAACAEETKCNLMYVKSGTAEKIMQPGITDACGQCYTDIALCSIAFCIMTCGLEPDSMPCVQCQFDHGCRVAYERCSGLDRQ
ncbi:MAG TPA: hypothetical protein VK550_34345 [Polyangiaceae bacterium]|jgi:hypothetical protein|nr:hypothetical protein [Polyangiaceae bacterium]